MNHPKNAYGPEVSIRTLFALLVAAAVLLAPALTRAGEAFAAVPDHHAQMMQSGHCKTVPSHSGDDNKSSDRDKAGMTCCVSLCMAVAETPSAPAAAVAMLAASPTFPLTHQYHGCIAEIATPPPRLA
jgi:hypothetical protein